MEERLIAPCGINCGVCVHYLAKKYDLKRQGFRKKYCAGCIPRGQNCTFMSAHCNRLGEGLVRFCYECADFPCKRLKALNKRYSAKYHMSTLENLIFIKENGMESFLDKESAEWKCSQCDEVICCHNGLCLHCDLEKLRQNKKYVWGEE